MMLIARRARLGVERELRVDDVVVAAEVAEVRARFDGGAREALVQPVVDATDRRRVAAHQRDDGRVIVAVDLRRARPSPDSAPRSSSAFDTIEVGDRDAVTSG